MAQFYSDCSMLEVGCELFLDSEFENYVPNGSYSDSSICYTVSNGTITFISSCPAPPSNTPTPTPTMTRTPTPTPTMTRTPTQAKVPLIINWELFEGSSNDDYVDANMKIFVNNILIEERYHNSSGTINIFRGDLIRIQYFYLSVAGLSALITNPKLQLLINNTLITDSPIIKTQDLTLNHTFTIQQNTDILVRGIGQTVIPSNTPTPTPTPTRTPTPTPTSAPPILSSVFYLSNGALDPNGHCGTNQLTGIPIYVSGEVFTVSGIFGKVAYTNSNLTTIYQGGGLYYFVDKNSGVSSQDILQNNNFYSVIFIDQFGNITDLQQINCSNQGGGGTIV